LIRLPPRLSPFPSTTLFRSCAHRNLAIVDLDVAASGAIAAAELAPAIAQPGVGAIVQRRAVYRRAGQRAQAVILLAVGAQHHAVDRKSTRLNSSHVKISYAV